MTDRKKPSPKTDGGTPSKSDRAVLKRAGEPAPGDAPDVGGFEAGKKIKAVDLSLHGDGVTHWQDEPISDRKKRRASRAKES